MNKSIMIMYLRSYKLYKSRQAIIERELSAKMQADKSDKDYNPELIKKLQSELSQLKYRTDMVEMGLKLAGEYNERYKIILEARYFNNVRIEDIADMTHMSRSRCYELCNEAAAYMSRIIFGDDQGRNVI